VRTRGNADFTTRTIPKVCGGVDPGVPGRCAWPSTGPVIDRVVQVSSTRAAEMTKLLENIHRAVNIGLVNEMKIVADRMGIDIHEVIRARGDQALSASSRTTPGRASAATASRSIPSTSRGRRASTGVHTRFIELAGDVNASMPDYVIAKVGAALNDQEKSIKGEPHPRARHRLQEERGRHARVALR
jgi:UDP-N-acetyl-D-glucosamine dehydrogenase